jgi:hypothetical protein
MPAPGAPGCALPSCTCTKPTRPPSAPAAGPGSELPLLDDTDATQLLLRFTLLPGGGAAAAATAEEVLGPMLQPVSGYCYPLPPVAAAASLELGSAAPLGGGNLYSHTGAFSGPPQVGAPADVANGGPLPASAPSPAAAAAAGCCVHAHALVLEFPEDAAMSQSLVAVRLLGPHAAVVGQPVSLLWQVTRVNGCATGSSGSNGSSDDLGDADVAAYELVEPAAAAAAWPGPAGAALALHPGSLHSSGGASGAGSGGGGGCGRRWLQAVGCRGALRLGRARGSVAVVEAMAVPLAAGLLPAPQLRLQGLRDTRRALAAGGVPEELSEDVIHVAPAGQ